MSAQTAVFNARPDPECGCAGKRLGFATRWETRTWLNDGTAVRIRPIRATDKRLELAFLNGLSRETRYQRLFSSRDLLPGELRRLTEIDYDTEMALIATIDRDGAPEQIGVARYVKTGKTTAELAIVVADCWQRHGVGTRLLEALVEHAGEAGIHTLEGLTLSTNLGMLRLAKTLGFSLRFEPGDATLMRMSMALTSRNDDPERVAEAAL